MLEERYRKSLEEAKQNRSQYHQLLLDIKGESSRLRACLQDVGEWTVAKDCLEIDKFVYKSMLLVLKNHYMSF